MNTVTEIDRPGWAVHIEAAGDPGQVIDDQLIDLLEQLTNWAGVTSGSYDGSRYGATFSIDADDLDSTSIFDALAEAQRVFTETAQRAGLPSLPIVRAEAMTYEEQEAELRRPLIPELVGVSEIAEILSVSRQRAHQLTKRNDFPDPIAKLSSGPIWTRPSLNRFVDEWRADKPDVTEELSQVDELLANVREFRNAVAHGQAKIDNDVLTSLLEWSLAHQMRDGAELARAMIENAEFTTGSVATDEQKLLGAIFGPKKDESVEA